MFVFPLISIPCASSVVSSLIVFEFNAVKLISPLSAIAVAFDALIFIVFDFTILFVILLFAVNTIAFTSPFEVAFILTLFILLFDDVISITFNELSACSLFL